MIIGHGGNIFALAAQLGCKPEQIADMSSNINPLGPLPQLVDYLHKHLDHLAVLPEVDSHSIVQSFAAYFKIAPQSVLAGHGTTQFIYSLPAALNAKKALVVGPTYADYADACRLQGCSADHFLARAKDGFHPDLNQLSAKLTCYDTVFVCNPNNPTGVLIPGTDLEALIKKHPATRFIIDESYLPFCPQGTQHTLLGKEQPNVIVLHSLSKIFAIPGLRVGFIKAARPIIERLAPHIWPWSVNTLAQAAATYLLNHKPLVSDFIAHTWAFLAAERTALVERIHARGMGTGFPSETSFVLIRLPQGLSAGSVHQALAKQRMLIRDCSNFVGLDDRYIRIALKTTAVNQQVTDLLAGLVACHAADRKILV